MAEFYCPYLGRLVRSDLGSPEQVVPLALGGSDDLCVEVERTANNKLGAAVDAPMIDLYAHRRLDFDLRGQSGKEPAFSRDVTVGGSPGIWEMGLRGGGVRLKPHFQKTKLPNGKINVNISGDPTKARKIAAEFRAAHEAKGRQVEFVETETAIESPEIRGTFNFDLVALGRFQSKLALGLGHWIFGDAWSCGAGATRLRRALWSTTADELNANAPAYDFKSPEDLRINTREREHLFDVVPRRDVGGGMALALPLFGEPGYVLTIAEPGEPSTAEILAVVVDVTTRKVRRLTIEEMSTEGRVDVHRPADGT